MASSPPPLQLEEQTQEDFFDKLVDDYDAPQSHSKQEDMAVSLSNLSLLEVEDSVSALEVNGLKDDQSLDFSDASKNDASIGVAQSEICSQLTSGVAKGAAVKEVQWSDFSVNSPEFGLVDFESNSFLDTGNGDLAISHGFSEPRSTSIENTSGNVSASVNSYEHSADLTEIQNWENLYPGWKYDSITGQWCQLDGYDPTTNTQSDFSTASVNTHEYCETKVQNAFEGLVLERSDAVNFRPDSHSVLETISEESVPLDSWTQVSHGSINYPHNMVFDPQYPEWYYDTITQAWYTLASYNHSLLDASSPSHDLQTNNVNSLNALSIDGHHVPQSGSFTMQEPSDQKSHLNTSGSGYGFQSTWQVPTNQENNLKASGGGYDQQNRWQTEAFLNNGDVAIFSSNQLTQSYHESVEYTGNLADKLLHSNNYLLKHNYGGSETTVPQNYARESMNQFIQPNMEQNLPTYLHNSSNYGTGSSIDYTPESFHGENPSYSQFSYTPNEGRSTAGRPPHALVTFGFGGKILVMKDVSSSSSSFVSGSQGNVGGVILIHSLVDLVNDKANFLNTSSTGGFGYIHALCQQSFPGPLVGGNATSKDVSKWMDDRIMNSESASMDFQNGLPLKLLLSLLKISCQHYGKLRSSYSVEPSLEGNDGPELAVSKLFASTKRNDAPFGGFGSFMHCMKNLPSEGKITATANEVQNLLLSGRRKEALQRAQEGQLWGLSLVLAAQFGEQFYSDTVKQMALRQFVCGSPLRTLCLLIAGQPADVFSTDNSCGLSSPVNGFNQRSQVLPNTMLDDWQENLAMITSNRTKDDELVIIHLGDCLWKERGEVTAAHACYLVAEANFEQYSDSARLCLIGVDHMKNPRTYPSPDAIQRTEVYEYSKVIGNSQFVLLPFQPYKLVYAYMLAEVGKISESLRYCQASMKILKNSARSPEVELWRTLFSSLEERLRTHQQGGYGTNLAPTKILGKFLNSIDRSIHHMIGSPPLPPMPQNSGENSLFQKVSNSQSTMAITSLMPSPSIDAMNDLSVDSNRKVTHNRSVSEPDFGRNAKQNSGKNGGVHKQGNASMSDGRSRFGRFGSQLLQKTVGWVSWSRHDRQAKLGESNKFYYDERLKRWVEEGAEIPAAEASLPPPPTAASLQNGISNYDVKNALNSNNSLSITDANGAKIDTPSEQGIGFPPLPPSQNQFSAYSRAGVRSRYVDTFHKGGATFTSSFHSPSTPSVKTLAGANFFIPSPPTNYDDQTAEATVPVTASASTGHESPPATSSLPLQRFPSMDNIAASRTPTTDDSLSRARAASWSGSFADISSSKEAVRMEQHSFVGSHVRSGSLMDDLHEVEL
ncbi:hypothetical protein KSP39_PZI014831 [Platanthera zijinensis]|uniref:Protein transport protein sec16 n=1 Tax=Platanthera zijinensis TaxID=2320716 RepID=A0AAP0BBB1_9ASPA